MKKKKNQNKCYRARAVTLINVFKKAICKPRHWNLGIGIGIGIGTDTTNAIISSYIRPMDTKPSRVVT